MVPTPESIIQASQLLWHNAFGCLPLLEDAMLVNPGYQFFYREGDCFSFGGPLKNVQWVCALTITQVQLMLHPKENLLLFEDTTGGPTYAGREEKTQALGVSFL